MKTIDIIDFIIKDSRFYDSCKVDKGYICSKLTIAPVNSEFLSELISMGLEFYTNGDEISFKRNID